jgi:acetylornithine/N-succinyldiaminopimelate aminotransferase
MLHIMQMTALLPTYAPFPFTLSHGLGDQVFSTDGQAFWDFYGGHCVASTGHCHPRVVAAIQAQAQSLLFYSTAGALAIREQAASALIAFATPSSGMGKVFFCNSGAEANENALKVAHKTTQRRTIVSIDGGWHGRSLSCLAATEDHKITQPYGAWLPPARRLPLNDLATLAAADFSDVCAVIIEPIQSLAGVRAASAEFLLALRAKTTASGTLLIFDEIQTGVGRLGAPFAATAFGVAPDMITSAKGLASGIPIGAVLLSEALAAQLAQGDLGSTFGGGPIACAALLATLAVIQDEALGANALYCEAQLRAGLAELGIAVLGRGLLLGVVHAQAAALKAHLFAPANKSTGKLYQAGILLGGSNDPTVLRLMPPLTLSSNAVAAFLHAVRSFPR